MTMVEDHDGVADDATETNALPHAEQFQPISLRHRHAEKQLRPVRMLRGDADVYNTIDW